MSEETNKQVESKVPLKGAVKPNSKPKSGGLARMFGTFRLLVGVALLGSVALLGYMYYEQDKAVNVLFTQQNQLVQRLTDSSNEYSAIQSDLLSLSQQLSQSTTLIAEQSLELERLNSEIIATRLRINDSASGTRQVWTLTEAESLLRLAQQRLIVSRDVRAALALYVASDDILKQINDPAIFSVRNILATDMAALRAVSEVDVQGIYLQLGALSESIDSLAVISRRDQRLSVDGSEAEDAEGGFFSSIVDSLGQYIVVSHRDEPIQPLLSPEQEFYLKQNIKLQLEQARISLLQEREEIYRRSISTAMENISLYLESSGNEKQSIIQALEGLQAAAVVVQVPVISNSLLALQQILPRPESGAGAL